MCRRVLNFILQNIFGLSLRLSVSLPLPLPFSPLSFSICLFKSWNEKNAHNLCEKQAKVYYKLDILMSISPTFYEQLLHQNPFLPNGLFYQKLMTVS
jgi:hypothetical protein